MGGYGALLATSDHPERVRAVAASSPATWRSFTASSPGAFDTAADFTANDLFARASSLRPASVRIDCGEDDPFITNVKALAEVVADETGFGDGFHDADYWRSRIPSQLDFFRRSLRS
jgi:enterochelin esterase-like enzyme